MAAYFVPPFCLQPIKAWRGVIRAYLSEGDLSQAASLRTDGVGFHNDMRRHARAINENLGRIVAQARSGAERITAAAGEIASGSAELSRRTEQQAATLEETAAGMEELSATVKANAENCETARSSADRADQVATRGGAMVGRMVETMGEIEKCSKQVGEIVGVIEDSRSRPTSSPSMPRSRRRARANRAAGSRWWPPRCAPWRSGAQRPRRSRN